MMQFKNFLTSPREASNNSSDSNAKRYSYYKSGVRVKFPKKGPPLRMQILPAYNPQNPSDNQGWATCLMNGQPTAWFGMIQAAKFVGHGDWKSTLPILSLASFEGKEPCPYLKLLNYCKNNPDWKYLVTKSGRFGTADFQDAILKPVKSVLLLNIVDVDNPGQGVQLGEFSYSVANSLLNVETGIVFQRNLQIESLPNASTLLATDPMLAYANGDITDPGKAPVFVVELPPVKPGQFGAGYTVRVEVARNQVTRRTSSDFELSERYHLDDPESFLNIPTGQDIVDELVMLLKGHKNANGIDETCAIAEAVGNTYRVPTVSAPGSVGQVQGWSLPPEEPEVVPATPVSFPPAGFAPNPATSASEPKVASVNTSPAVPQGMQPYNGNPADAHMAIPGELPAGGEAALAASLAARMRSQMGLRK